MKGKHSRDGDFLISLPSFVWSTFTLLGLYTLITYLNEIKPMRPIVGSKTTLNLRSKREELSRNDFTLDFL